MFSSNPFVQDRIRKIQDLRALGIDPYPVPAYSPTQSLSDVVLTAEALISKSEAVRIAGRIIARRDKGKAVFMDLQDDGQKLQVYFRRSNLDQRTWRRWSWSISETSSAFPGPSFVRRLVNSLSTAVK
jgi:lysyl-tRNA synthetase class 2